MPLAGLWAQVSNAGVVTDALAKTTASYADIGLAGDHGLLHHACLQLLRMGGMDDRYGPDRYGMVLASATVAGRLCVRLLNKCEELNPLFATIPQLTGPTADNAAAYVLDNAEHFIGFEPHLGEFLFEHSQTL